MKFFLALSILATLALAKDLPVQTTTAFGYLKNIAIPEAERIRKAEEAYLNNPERIVGGSPAEAPMEYQAGLLINMVGSDGIGVCGAALISTDILLTAAHCWYDGRNQAWKFTVVLGSITLFTGGLRIETTDVVTHPDWQPSLIRNDIAVITLPITIVTTENISPISLPSGHELTQTHTGEAVIASGYGVKADGAGIASNQFLSKVSLTVISNAICNLSFFGIIQSSNICTSGSGGTGPCGGDSGGPLVIQNNDGTHLVGLVSFGSAFGCEVGWPAAYVRVSHYMDFIHNHM